jgi:hypothetical protein
MDGKPTEVDEKSGFASLPEKNLHFEGFEGAFGSENFQDHCDTSTSNGLGHTAADAQRSNSAGGNRNQVTASPNIKYGYGVATSILPTLSLSWFGGSTDKNPSESKEASSTDHNDLAPESSTAPPDDRAAAVSNCTALGVLRPF